MLSATRGHGYDFTYQGLLPIWLGLKRTPSRTPVSQDQTPKKGTVALSSSSGSTEASLKMRSRSRSTRRSGSPIADYHDALAAIVGGQVPESRTGRAAHRQVGLMMCGWSLREDEMNDAVKKWEKEGSYSRAACWLVFKRQHSRAIELLMRSKGYPTLPSEINRR
jgi:WD repeat-containing protein mio